MLDGVLEQRVDGKPEAFRVGERRRLVELPELPVPCGGRPPAPENVSNELIELDSFRPQEIRVGRCGASE